MNMSRVSAILAVLWVIGAVLIIQMPIGQVLPAATDHAKAIDAIFKFMLVASWAVFLIVQGFLLYFAVRYRKRPEDPPEALGAQIHGNTRIEILWTTLPAIFLIALTAISYKVYVDITTPPKNAYMINALGFQFGWQCTHPAEKITETSTCHMPVNREITINLESKDVIHSFWVPEFRVKQDDVPGLHNKMHFKTERIGTYPLICAELCGVGHSGMRGTIYVMSQADFATWVKQQQQAQSGTGPVANLSFKNDIEPLFQQHCAACHISTNLGGLSLATYQGLLKGGSIVPGPIIKPGSHAASLLYHMISPTGPWPGGNRMPLGGPYLAPSEINKIAAWIDQGAKNN
ncbi:MAG TPA: cytochrome c oxidase subunit II [Chloroflexota bacterium]|jgi:cytochrome c oxidase subunit 2|nr:cytochrome c oxidase subunit II [Chloroflexota bacterium]